MLSNNPLLDKYKITFTDDFFIKEITDKYDSILQQKNYPLLNIKSMIIESIKKVTTPSFGFEPYEQTQADGNYAGYGNYTVSKSSEQLLAESQTLTLTFRHSDGFLTYWCLFELFLIRYKMGVGTENTRKPFSGMILQNFYQNGKPSCKMYYNQCIMKSFPSLNLSYDNPDRSITEFDVDFNYTTFTPSLEVPQLILK